MNIITYPMLCAAGCFALTGPLLLRAAEPVAKTEVANQAFTTERTIASPNGSLVFLLERESSTNVLAWSATFGGRPLITRGALGMDIKDVGRVADKGPIGPVEKREVKTSWKPPYGERSEIPDRFREETLALAPPAKGGPAVRLQVRAYDEGLAFRYLVDAKETVTVLSEQTSFPLAATTDVWTSEKAQGKITRQPVSAVKGQVERPLTAQLSPNLFAALGEAALVNHSRMKFTLDGESTLVASLDGPAVYAGAFATPWRYVRAASSPGGLLEKNHFLLNLNEPNQTGDTAWLRPGKILREVTLTTQGAKACVDFAASHNLQFIMFDAGWYGPEENDRSDATTVTVDPARSPGPLDLPDVIAYGKSKGIGTILYVNRLALERQLDELLPLYQKWGVAGIKFGFVNVGPQQWTTWLHDAIAKCAKYNLMVNVHDEYRMTGVERTLPNFMTAEGVRGDEESPKSEEVLHTLFTRGLAGAADQTNCYFAQRVGTMGSHGAQLAKAVCLYSPWLSVFWYDRPAGAPQVGQAGGGISVLQDVPEMSFFKRLPTVWDEIRVLGGHPDTHAIVARRNGDTWFIGGLNGTKARDFKIPLPFLGVKKSYRLGLFTDDPSIQTPTQVRVETRTVDRNHVIECRVAPRNGIAAILTPVPDPPRTAADAVTPKLFDQNRHNQFMKRKAAGPIDLLFLGDSITDWWPKNGKDSWSAFAPYQPANFGIMAMRTEGLLWNINNGEIDGLTPKTTVILIGVNNILQCPDEKPEWVAAGIEKIVATVREKMPATNILLMGILPARNPASHPARARIAEVNRLIAKLDDGKHVRFLDIGSQFLDADGNVRKDLTSDLLHPNAKGYQVWKNALLPIVSDNAEK